MNTTASISDPAYTVLSSVESEQAGFHGISIVLLSRGGKPFRREKINKLFQQQVKEVLSVENSGCDLESITRNHASLKCILPHGEMSTGEKINIAVREASGSHVLVIWDDMDLQIAGKTGRLFDQAAKRKVLCSVPVLMNSSKESIPTRIAPVFSGKKLEVLPLGSVNSDSPTLYPFDYCGIYDRNMFLLSDGYDPKIHSPYWQKLDFGFRAFLWGDAVQCYSGIKVAYQSEIPSEDTSIDESYIRFYLKNLAFTYRDETARLSFMDILGFHLKSGSSLFSSFGSYKEIYEWVRKNRFRFRMDPYSLTELWELK